MVTYKTTYEKVNDAVWYASRNHAHRGLRLFVLMNPETFYRYRETTPPGECGQWPGNYPTVQGYKIIRADVEGYVICRGV